METNGELSAHITTAAAIVYFIQWMKASGYTPWLTADTTTLNRITSALFAAIAAIGINWSYDASLQGGTLIITGISWVAIAHGAFEWFKQFTLQQLVFDGIVQKKESSV
jgi:hypothetical protein